MAKKKRKRNLKKNIYRLLANGEVDKALKLAETSTELGFLFDMGMSKLNEGDAGTAEKIFDLVTRINPGFLPAWLNKGSALFGLGRLEEAIQAFDKILSTNPNDANTWANKGSALFALDKHQAALRAFENALELDPNMADVWYHKSLAFSKLGMHQEAFRSAENAFAIGKDYLRSASLIEAFYRTGTGFNSSGRHEDSIIAFNKVLEIDPTDAKSWTGRGVSLDNLGRHQEAIQAHERALAIDPRNAKIWYNRGVALANIGRLKEALQDFDKALELNPDMPLAWDNKGAALGNLGRNQEAIQAHDKALELDPHLANAWHNKAISLYRLGVYQEALQACDKALELSPNVPKAWYHKGLTLASLSKDEEATQAYERALELDPSMADAWFQKGLALRQLDRYEDAVQAFDRAIGIDPYESNTHLARGFALDDLARYQEAIQAYSKSLEIDPGNEAAWFCEGIALHELGKYEEAIQAYSRALEIDPLLAAAQANRGIALFNKHEYTDSLRDLRMSGELFSGTGKQDAVNMVHGYELWSEGLQNWALKRHAEAGTNFHDAAASFTNCGEGNMAVSLELLSRLMPIDEDFMVVLTSHSLSNLAGKSRRLSRGMRNLLKQFQAARIHKEIVDLIEAKMICISVLADALKFRDNAPNNLSKAREVLRTHGLTESVKAVNHLENFILGLQKYRSIKEIPADEKRHLLLALKPVEALNGYISRRISDTFPRPSFTVKPETWAEAGKITTKWIEETMATWVRVCLVQIGFIPRLLAPPQEFGYRLEEVEKETVKQKVFSALHVAHREQTNIICFPELSFAPEWVEEVESQFSDMIVVGGSYYEDAFNVCPIIIQGTCYLVRKINPSPLTEGEVGPGRGMRSGKEILVFQTRFGSFVPLICYDYRKQAHRILFNPDETKRNVDFIINPSYNKDVGNFQERANQDCQEGNYPYILQVNSLRENEGKSYGGTCIVGMDHEGALQRYVEEGYKPRDDHIKNKLLQAEGEMMLIADLDIKRKGVPVPASVGPKMKLVGRYVYQDGSWRKQY